MNRRALLQAAAGFGATGLAMPQGTVKRVGGTHLRIALNSYSFNKPLMDGTMTLSQLVRFCAEHGIEALDATGYYFPGYPKTPPPEFVRNLKREAFLNGVTIFGTGVRNDFAVADPAARQRDVQLVKDWIDVAVVVGASIVRVFSGKALPQGHTFDQVLAWMAPLFRECAEYGRSRGVMLGLQNHNDFLKTADETIRVVKAVDSEWFGVTLDVGSLRQNDAYAEIEKLLPYAVSWQLKENVGYGKEERPTDLRKVKAIIERGGYRGYLPIETLGAGDSSAKVTKFLADVRAVFASDSARM